ncbi:MAG TPA: His/Gly/Thr/Pro-type tRNA ligase C-terminal domain-containing protein, partial [Steroidobacteraceae bacterium]|nr:His/Gly/Thr/Pro-type tRNA ligase C-terminal domain-containing protein [Steroidobacteraceae bacterium]
AERLRNEIKGLRLETLCGGGGFKSQLKRADKSGARYAIILGDNETERAVAGLKSLRVDEPQIDVAWDALAGELRKRL